MIEHRVKTWEELHNSLFADSWRPDIGRYRTSFVFRGKPYLSQVLTSGLVRLGGDLAQVEKSLLRNFRKYARSGAVSFDNIWAWLALAQHHGLPTRMLDWTYSPYVALHFATLEIDYTPSDACVWAIDLAATRRALPCVMKKVLDENDAFTFTEEMLAEVASTLTAFDALADEPFLCFFEPPSLDDRIVNQFALFSLMSSPTATIDTWLGTHPAAARCIVIPQELKGEIRDKLDQANITERVLFPGLDGLCAWLRRYYRPKSPDGIGYPPSRDLLDRPRADHGNE